MSREIDNGITVTEFLTQILNNPTRQDLVKYLIRWSFVLTIISVWCEQDFIQEMGCLDSGLL